MSSPRNLEDWMRAMERRTSAAHRAAEVLTRTVGNTIRDEVATTVTRTPTAPIELDYQTSLYTDPRDGKQRGRVTIDFPDVTRATDGTTIDIVEYELWAKDVTIDPFSVSTSAVAGLAAPGLTLPGLADTPDTRAAITEVTPEWFKIQTSTTSSIHATGFPPGSVIEFKVRAVAAVMRKAGNFSPVVAVQMLEDTTPPAQPTAPKLLASHGTIRIDWDGQAVNGPMPADFDYLVVAMGSSSSPINEIHRFHLGEQTTTVGGFEYYETQFVRFQAVDTNGNKSVWSAQTTAHITPLVDEDIILSTIDAAETVIENAGTIMLLPGERLDTKLETLDVELGAASEAVTEVKGRLTTAETTLSGINGSITEIDSKLATNTTELGAAKIGLEAVEVELYETFPTRISADISTAKQQALDAAALTAQQKADAAEAAAIQAAKDDAAAKVAVVASQTSAAQSDATAALTAAQSAQATADGSIRTFYEPTAPQGLNNTTHLGDLWYDTDTDQAHRWDGTQWNVIQDSTIAVALGKAENAQATADGKITSFYQDVTPSEGQVGDLWFDTNDDKKPYYCTSSDPLLWEPVRDGQIAKTEAAAFAEAKAKADAALAAAKTDATTKKNEAIAAAATDATSKANTAKAEALAEAATAAQQKVDTAAATLQADINAALASGQSIIIGGDFEGAQWGANPDQSPRTSATARSGSKVMFLNPAGKNVYPTSNYVPSGKGKTFYLEAYFRRIGAAFGGSDRVAFVVQSNTAANGYSTPIAGFHNASILSTTEWTKVSTTYTIPDTVDAVRTRFAPWAESSTNDYEVDDFTVIDITAATDALNAAKDDATTKKNEAIAAAALATDQKITAATPGILNSAAEDAKKKADAATAEAQRLWSSAARSFYFAGDRDDMHTGTTFTLTAVDDGTSSSVLRKTGNNNSIYFDKDPLPFDPNALYRITWRVRVVTDATNVTSPTIYAGVHTLNKDKQRISTGGSFSSSSAHYFAAGPEYLKAADGWRSFTGYFKGYGGASGNGGESWLMTEPGRVHPDTRYVTPMAFLDYPGGDGTWDVGMVAVDVIDPAQVEAVVAAQVAADNARRAALDARNGNLVEDGSFEQGVQTGYRVASSTAADGGYIGSFPADAWRTIYWNMIPTRPGTIYEVRLKARRVGEIGAVLPSIAFDTFNAAGADAGRDVYAGTGDSFAPTTAWQEYVFQTPLDGGGFGEVNGFAKLRTTSSGSSYGTGRLEIDDVRVFDVTAQRTADLALNSANGKNARKRSLSAANANDPGKTPGDTWWQYKDDTWRQVIAQWAWSGSAWLPEKLSHETIASVDLGTLTVVGQSTLADVVAKEMSVQVAKVIELDVGRLRVTGTSHLETATANTIFSDLMTSNKILTSHLAVTDLTNFAPNAKEDPKAWIIDGPAYINTAASGQPGGWEFKHNGGGSGSTVIWGPLKEVRPGESLYASMGMWRASGATQTVNLRWYWYNSSKTYLSQNSVSSTTTPSTSLQAVAPAGASYGRLVLVIYLDPAKTGAISLHTVQGFKQAGATLIEPNGITTENLNITGEMGAALATVIELNVDKLKVTGTANIKSGVAEAFFAKYFEANKIYANQVVIGRGPSLVANGRGELDKPEGWSKELIIDKVDTPPGVIASFKNPAGSGTLSGRMDQGPMLVEPNTEYVFEAWIKADKPNSRFYMDMRDQDGTLIGGISAIPGKIFAGGTGRVIDNYTVPTVWTQVHASIKTAATTSTLRIAGLYFNHPNGSEQTAQVWLAGLSVKPMMDGSLVVENTIYTRHLNVTEDMTVALLNVHKVKAIEIDTNDLGADTSFIGLMRGKILEVDVVRSDMIHATNGITAKHTITGAMFQTTATANRGVKYNSAGIKAWDSVGQQTFDLNASNGYLTVFGGKITGAMFETHPEVNRGIKISAADFSAYSTSGARKFFLDFGDGDAWFESRVAFGRPNSPRWVIVPWEGAAQERAGIWLVAGNAVGLGGEETAGMYMDNANGTFPNTLKIRGSNGGGVESFGRFYNADMYSGTIHHSGGLYHLQGANGSYFMSSLEMHGRLLTKNTPATTSTANAHIASADGTIFKSSSAARYKVDPQPLALPDALLEVPVKDWIDRGQLEQHQELDAEPRPHTYEVWHALEGVVLDRIPGVIAEEVEAVEGGDRFVTYDRDGLVESVNYDRFALARTAVLKRQLDAALVLIEELSVRVSELETA